MKRILQPRHVHNEGAEPLMSPRRPCLNGPIAGVSFVEPLWGMGSRNLANKTIGKERGGSLPESLKGERGNGLALRAQDPDDQ